LQFAKWGAFKYEKKERSEQTKALKSSKLQERPRQERVGGTTSEAWDEHKEELCRKTKAMTLADYVERYPDGIVAG
jgi:hypothetical protein